MATLNGDMSRSQLRPGARDARALPLLSYTRTLCGTNGHIMRECRYLQ